MDTRSLRRLIRSKRLGVLLRDARISAGKALRACAQAVGLRPGRLRAYEEGRQAPSLPELAVLAYVLRVPIEHFWEEEVYVERENPANEVPLEELFRAYNQRIAERLREAREKQGLSLREVAHRTGIPVSRLRSYERGEKSIPVPELEQLLEVLGVRMSELWQDAPGVLGEWLAQQRRIRGFLELPEELQEFVSQPRNRPYLEVAQRLSHLSVDQLRAVAEGLLEITL